MGCHAAVLSAQNSFLTADEFVTLEVHDFADADALGNNPI
jgi:hypothetical protein